MPQSNFGSVALRTPHLADVVEVPAVAALPTIEIGSGGGRSNAAFRPSNRHGIVASDLGRNRIGPTTDNYCFAYLHQDVNYYADACKHRSAKKNRPLEDLVDGRRYLSINADCVVERQCSAHNKCRTCKSRPSHSRSKSLTVHLGFFKSERKHVSQTALLAIHSGSPARLDLSDRHSAEREQAGGGAVLRHANGCPSCDDGREDSGRGGACLCLLPGRSAPRPVGEIVRYPELGNVTFGRPVAGAAGDLLDRDLRRHVAIEPLPIEVAVPCLSPSVETPSNLRQALPTSEAIARRGHPIPSPAIHLGFFEGERKQASRGWDEDTSTAARNILAMLAVACFLMAVSLLVDAIDAQPTIDFVAGETSR